MTMTKGIRVSVTKTACLCVCSLMLFKLINSFPNDTILGMSKFKANADDKYGVAEIMGFAFERVENIVGKGNVMDDHSFKHGFLP